MISKIALDAVLNEIEAARDAWSTLSDTRLHAVAADTCAVKNIATCSKFRPPRKKSTASTAPARSGVKLVKSGGRVKFTGLARCKAHQICPICHSVWLREQRQKLARLVEHWPGHVNVLTLTIRHRRTEKLSDVLKKLQDVRRLFTESPGCNAAWISGLVLRVEISLGPNGWHPHLHGLVYSHNEPTAVQASALEGTWRAAAAVAGYPVGKHAAKLETAKGKKAVHIATGYVCKQGPASAHALLRVIAAGTASPKVIESARKLWREYCNGIVARNRMRYISAAGKEVKDALATYSKTAKTKQRAIDRISEYVDHWNKVSDGEWSLIDLSALFLERVLTDAHSRRYSAATQHRIGQLRDRLAEALELREESGYSADFDPYGDVDEISRELTDVLAFASSEPEGLPELGELTDLGATVLARLASQFEDVEYLSDVRHVIKAEIARRKLPVKPEDLFIPNYEGLGINSMVLPGIEPPSKPGK